MPRKNNILIRSGTAAPSAADFNVGEPAWDKTNGKLYIKNAAGTMVDVTGSGGSGSAELTYSYATTSAFPATGNTGLLYFATDSGRMYRWTGSVYVEVGSIGATLPWQPAPATSASAGNVGDAAYDGTYLYICTQANIWKAAPITRWDADANFSNVSLLLHMDGTNGSTTFTDSSGSPKTVTANGSVSVSTTQSKFGGASGSFASGNYLTLTSSSAFAFTADFTIEGWFYFNSNSSGYQPLITSYAGADATGCALILESNNTLTFYGATTSSWNVAATSSSVPTTSTWHHIAVSRTGTALTLYLNGTSIGSTTNSSSIASGNTFAIGHYAYFPGGAKQFSGYIDEVRVTKGTGRYSAAFTPATTAFPNY